MQSGRDEAHDAAAHAASAAWRPAVTPPLSRCRRQRRSMCSFGRSHDDSAAATRLFIRRRLRAGDGHPGRRGADLCRGRAVRRERETLSADLWRVGAGGGEDRPRRVDSRTVPAPSCRGMPVLPCRADDPGAERQSGSAAAVPAPGVGQMADHRTDRGARAGGRADTGLSSAARHGAGSARPPAVQPAARDRHVGATADAAPRRQSLRRRAADDFAIDAAAGAWARAQSAVRASPAGSVG
ncbi:hypothetical protein OJJOAM_001502 [Cupriavidus sp. H18C1]